jgi:thiamine-phosphate diphosphorylase
MTESLREDLARHLALYVLTDRELARGRPETEVVAQAIAGGATMIQLRAKTLTTWDMLQAAREVRRVTLAAGVPFILNDRVDVALAADSDGVHVGHIGQEDLPPDIARRLLGPARIVGVSVATPEEARLAEELGADYVAVGPIYQTATKADAGAGLGLAGVRAVRTATRLPVVAIGGITAAMAGEVVRAGADGVAVIAAVVAAEDIAEAARAMRAEVEAAKRTRG